MCMRLASDLSLVFAAVAAVEGLRFPASNVAVRPMPLLALHGADDKIYPWKGDGDGDFWQESVLEAAFHWGRFNGCNESQEERPNPLVELYKLSQCANGHAEVRVMKIAGGGHVWPTCPVAGRCNGEVDANDLIHRFFQSVQSYPALASNKWTKGIVTLDRDQAEISTSIATSVTSLSTTQAWPANIAATLTSTLTPTLKSTLTSTLRPTLTSTLTTTRTRATSSSLTSTSKSTTFIENKHILVLMDAPSRTADSDMWGAESEDDSILRPERAPTQRPTFLASPLAKESGGRTARFMATGTASTGEEKEVEDAARVTLDWLGKAVAALLVLGCVVFACVSGIAAWTASRRTQKGATYKEVQPGSPKRTFEMTEAEIGPQRGLRKSHT